MDIVIQGGIYPGTIETAKLYSDFSEVDRVIISCWEDDEYSDKDRGIIEDSDNITILGNEKPKCFGAGNVNMQIISSLNGIQEATSDVVMKIRSDQRLYYSAFNEWNSFFKNHITETPMKFIDVGSPKGKLFIIGMNHTKPYHPQDHIVWGYKEDVSLFFDIPLSESKPLPPEVNGKIDWSAKAGNFRCPIYLGMQYFARFSKEAKKHSENIEEYLYDFAPSFDEAMNHYEDIRDSIFRVLPRIDDCMWWEKFNSGYWYELYHSCGERYV
jgi:hypothetical protein